MGDGIGGRHYGTSWQKESLVFFNYTEPVTTVFSSTSVFSLQWSVSLMVKNPKFQMGFRMTESYFYYVHSSSNSPDQVWSDLTSDWFILILNIRLGFCVVVFIFWRSGTPSHWYVLVTKRIPGCYISPVKTPKGLLKQVLSSVFSIFTLESTSYCQRSSPLRF